jgi:hypothetical protein
MNECVKCHLKFNPHKKGATWLFCDSCGSDRTEQFIKAQIGLVTRLHDASDDEEFKAECMKRKISYIGELQA